MRKHTAFLTLALAFATAAQAQTALEGVSVQQASLKQRGDTLAVSLTLDLSQLSVKRNRALLLTPLMVSEADSLTLEQNAVYGRRRYFQYLRKHVWLAPKDENNYRMRNKPSTVTVSELLPASLWPAGADLKLRGELYGCCGIIVDEQELMLARYLPFAPRLVYITPSPGKDTLALEGRAYINFHVDKTAIDPNYMNNPRELAAIRATIDSVKNDPDITVTSVWLKGFASPESPYSHNRDLAKGRTEVLKNYIQNLYNFPEGTVTTDFEPEDWQGLRAYVEGSGLEHRQQIIDIIDTEMDPDAKEAKIKATYPAEYNFLLTECYPSLLHTEYHVSYLVRMFTDIEEIRRVYASEPHKLSLNELYRLALTYEPGSEEFVDVFEPAARMYPASDVAHVNAACAAWSRGDKEAAAHYIAQAGDSGEADYLRGIMAMDADDTEAALRLFQSAKQKGVAEADYCIDYINHD